jgi:hypothetical protein
MGGLVGRSWVVGTMDAVAAKRTPEQGSYIFKIPS